MFEPIYPTSHRMLALMHQTAQAQDEHRRLVARLASVNASAAKFDPTHTALYAHTVHTVCGYPMSEFPTAEVFEHYVSNRVRCYRIQKMRDMYPVTRSDFDRRFFASSIERIIKAVDKRWADLNVEAILYNQKDASPEYISGNIEILYGYSERSAKVIHTIPVPRVRGKIDLREVAVYLSTLSTTLQEVKQEDGSVKKVWVPVGRYDYVACPWAYSVPKKYTGPQYRTLASQAPYAKPKVVRMTQFMKDFVIQSLTSAADYERLANTKKGYLNVRYKPFAQTVGNVMSLEQVEAKERNDKRRARAEAKKQTQQAQEAKAQAQAFTEALKGIDIDQMTALFAMVQQMQK